MSDIHSTTTAGTVGPGHPRQPLTINWRGERHFSNKYRPLIIFYFMSTALPGQVVLKHCCFWRSCPRQSRSGSPGGQVLCRLMVPVPQEVLQGLHGPQELQLLQPCSSVGTPTSGVSNESGQSTTPLHT